MTAFGLLLQREYVSICLVLGDYGPYVADFANVIIAKMTSCHVAVAWHIVCQSVIDYKN